LPNLITLQSMQLSQKNIQDKYVYGVFTRNTNFVSDDTDFFSLQKYNELQFLSSDIFCVVQHKICAVRPKSCVVRPNFDVSCKQPFKQTTMRATAGMKQGFKSS
jgi:hypothetical protein